MVNTQLLDERISQSGLKIGYIVDKIGISRMAFNKKKNGKTPFRTSEIYVICDLLNIRDQDEKVKIFYPESKGID